jgi:pyruvoyl-dependent arginine decarboxylase (PvlArgDC)
MSKRSGLLTRIATTEGVGRADEKLTAFLELETAIRTAPASNFTFLRNRP